MGRMWRPFLVKPPRKRVSTRATRSSRSTQPLWHRDVAIASSRRPKTRRQTKCPHAATASSAPAKTAATSKTRRRSSVSVVIDTPTPTLSEEPPTKRQRRPRNRLEYPDPHSCDRCFEESFECGWVETGKACKTCRGDRKRCSFLKDIAKLADDSDVRRDYFSSCPQLICSGRRAPVSKPGSKKQADQDQQKREKCLRKEQEREKHLWKERERRLWKEYEKRLWKDRGKRLCKQNHSLESRIRCRCRLSSGLRLQCSFYSIVSSISTS